jgi:cell wall-associated NlpC family hydrolase
VSARAELLAEFVGSEWTNRGMCWGLARHVERVLFGRDLPDVAVPAEPTWSWIIGAIRDHAERHNWRELPRHPLGIITAEDGALVLMARMSSPAHVGVWLKAEARVIHAPTLRVRAEQDDCAVVGMIQTPAQLRASGWRRLTCFEPI